MKKQICTIALMLTTVSIFSQELFFEVKGDYEHPIKKNDLMDVAMLRDFIPSYPISWIVEYISVEISTSENGKPVVAQGKEEKLTQEQKNLFQSSTLGSQIIVNVNYKTENSVTGKLDTRRMNYTMSIVPEVPATFVGGDAAMNKYLKSKSSENVKTCFMNSQETATVKFTVNEQGLVCNVFLAESSGDTQVDELLLEAIRKMPKWNAAKNATGGKVSQNFVYHIGNGGC
jgi:TonB family protein